MLEDRGWRWRRPAARPRTPFAAGPHGALAGRRRTAAALGDCVQCLPVHAGSTGSASPRMRAADSRGRALAGGRGGVAAGLRAVVWRASELVRAVAGARLAVPGGDDRGVSRPRDTAESGVAAGHEVHVPAAAGGRRSVVAVRFSKEKRFARDASWTCCSSSVRWRCPTCPERDDRRRTGHQRREAHGTGLPSRSWPRWHALRGGARLAFFLIVAARAFWL